MKQYVRPARDGFYVYTPRMHKLMPDLDAVKNYFLALQPYTEIEIIARKLSEPDKRELFIFEGTILKGKSLEEAAEDYMRLTDNPPSF